MNGGWSVVYALRKLFTTQYVLILLITVAGVLGGLVFGYKQPVTFTARTSVVTGTYSLPSNIGIQGVIDKTGPLALELPAETQAIIIASPVITNAASDALGVDGTAARDMAESVKASPATDNSFTITAQGPSAKEAADYANAVASSYLAYRAELGKASMNKLAGQYTEQADASASAAKALDKSIQGAGGANTSTGASLVARQQELLKQAEQARGTAASLTAMALDFKGGGSVLERATADKTTRSLSLVVYGLLGLAGGLGLGIVAAAVRRQVSPRITDRLDIVRTLEGVAVFAERTAGDPALGPLLWRTLSRILPLGQGQSGTSVLAVQALSSPASGFRAATALAEAATSAGRSLLLYTESGEAARKLSGADAVSAAGLEELDGAARRRLNGLSLNQASYLAASSRTLQGDMVTVVIGDPFASSAEGHASLPEHFAGPVLLSVEEGTDSADGLFDAVDQLRMSGLDVAAVVLTKAPRRFGRFHGRRKSRGPQRAGLTAVASDSGSTAGEDRDSGHGTGNDSGHDAGHGTGPASAAAGTAAVGSATAGPSPLGTVRVPGRPPARVRS